jgi:hypothetical protein
MDVGIGEIADIAPTGFDVRFRHKADIATAACPLLEVKRTSRFQSVMAASLHVTEVVLCLPPAENIYINVKIIRFSDSRGLL